MKIIDDFVSELIQRAEEDKHRAAMMLSQSRTTIDFARMVKRVKGKKWVRVGKVKLKEGRLYIIRRVYGRFMRQPPDDPALAVWGALGWDVLRGKIYETSGDASIEVWA